MAIYFKDDFVEKRPSSAVQGLKKNGSQEVMDSSGHIILFEKSKSKKMRAKFFSFNIKELKSEIFYLKAMR